MSVQFIKAIEVFAAALNSATKTLREAALAAGFKTPEEAQPLVLEWASKRYSVPLVESKSPRNKGAKVLDRSASGFEAAKKAAQRVMDALKGDADVPTTADKAEELEIPAELMAAAAKLAKLASEYEGARKLASKALADAFVALKG